MLLDVVEAEGEDLDDDLKKDFGPRLFFRFVFHKSKMSKNGSKNYLAAQISKRVSSWAVCSARKRAVREDSA